MVGNVKDLLDLGVSKRLGAIKRWAHYINVSPRGIYGIANTNLECVVNDPDLHVEGRALRPWRIVRPLADADESGNVTIHMVVREHRVVNGVSLAIRLHKPGESNGCPPQHSQGSPITGGSNSIVSIPECL
jgi:hypothetical protein